MDKLLGLLPAVAGVEDHQSLLQHALAGVVFHHDLLLLPLLAVVKWLLAAVFAAVACCAVQGAECALKTVLVAVAPQPAPLQQIGLNCLGSASCLGPFGEYHTEEDFYPEPLAVSLKTQPKIKNLQVQRALLVASALEMEKDLATLLVAPLRPLIHFRLESSARRPNHRRP